MRQHQCFIHDRYTQALYKQVVNGIHLMLLYLAAMFHIIGTGCSCDNSDQNSPAQASKSGYSDKTNYSGVVSASNYAITQIG